MSLIECPECGHSVSSRAGACPNCGCPVEPPQLPGPYPEAERPTARPRRAPARAGAPGRPPRARAGRLPPFDGPKREGLWLGIGIFFFVAYFIPIASSGKDSIFWWDFFDADTARGASMLGLYALSIMLIGVALPIVAYNARGIARPVTIMSMGAFGLFLYFLVTVSVSDRVREGFMYGYTGVTGPMTVLTLASLAAALVGNSLRRDHPDAPLARGMSAVGAGAACFFLLVGAIMMFTEGMPRRFPDDAETTVTIMRVLVLLASMTVMAGCIVVLVSLGPAGDGRDLVATGQKLMIWGLVAQGAIILILTTVMVGQLVGDSRKGGEIVAWLFFLLLRVLGYLYGLAVVMAVGLADLLRHRLDHPPVPEDGWDDAGAPA